MIEYVRLPPLVHILRSSLETWWRQLLPLTLLSALWLALTVTVVLFPIATAGLFFGANRLVYNQPLTVGELRAGIRRYAWVSVQWALANAATLAVTFGAVWAGATGGCLTPILLLIGTAWLVPQWYVWPFLLEQRSKRLTNALQSSALMAVAMPGLTLSLNVLIGALIVISLATVLPAVAFASGFIAVLANYAVIDRLAMLGQTPDAARAEP